MHVVTLFNIWLTLAGLIGLVWLIYLVKIGVMLRKRRQGSSGSPRRRGSLTTLTGAGLPEMLSSHSYHGAPADAHQHRVSVVVAAKDEEDNIEACVRGLLEQDYPNYELIVVDDRSRDRTPAILRRLEQQSDGRLNVITVSQLSAGWFGKNNAMREGVAASDGNWLLFTDADCRQISTRTISMAVREALAYEVDFLSVTPLLETHTVWERIIQPVCAITLMIWFLPHHVNKPKSKTAYANGAFMLMRRSCYNAIGGHERVRNEVNEDVQMARLARLMGLRLRVVENDDLYVTRMYDSLRGAWHGWSRIFHGCLESFPRLGASALLLVLLCVVPWTSLAIASAALAVADNAAVPWGLACCIWATVVVSMQAVTWRLYGILRAGRAWSLTYLLGAVVTLGMLANAMFKATGAGRTTWRGTTYRNRRVEETGRGAALGETVRTQAVDEPAANA